MDCIIQVVGKKDSGKTSAIERAVKSLKDMGYSVTVLKHSHHSLDSPGKDTFRFKQAGADYVLFFGNDCGMFIPCDINIIYLLPTDILIIEGYKDLSLGQKIEIESPSQIESVSERIVKLGSLCSKLEGKFIVNGGNEVDINRDKMLKMLYKLLNFLNIKELSVRDS
ncbi:hypothetical protein SUSAZ_00515 [Sulfolobus acidocaldarius SUSAZ]|nr:hypothetical protein SUSAZ_00515 [Sulfolobus acidocaldarius SUSAZ]